MAGHWNYDAFLSATHSFHSFFSEIYYASLAFRLSINSVSQYILLFSTHLLNGDLFELKLELSELLALYGVVILWLLCNVNLNLVEWICTLHHITWLWFYRLIVVLTVDWRWRNWRRTHSKLTLNQLLFLLCAIKNQETYNIRPKLSNKA